MTKQLRISRFGAAILLFGACAAQAQQAPAVKSVTIRFGQPAPADFEAKNSVGDSAASAVVLYDFGSTRFRLNGLRLQLESDRVTRIRVLKKAGYDVATVEVPLKRSYELHCGTAADVNLLLIAALREAGLPAEPVLLSTRSHGRVNQFFPLLEQCNYVTGVLPLGENQELLLDATDPLLLCGLLPTRCLNQVGRLVPGKEGAGRWVTLTPAQRHLRYQAIKMTLDAQGILSSQVRDVHGGYAAASAREKLASLGEEKYLAELANHHSGWDVPTYSFQNANDPTQSLALRYELRRAAGPAGPANELYLSPLAASLSLRVQQGKRTQATRYDAITALRSQRQTFCC